MQPALAFVTLLALSALHASAAIVEKPVEYRDGDTVLEGVLYFDDSATTPRPGVLVIPEWWGLHPFVKDQARRVAELGYVAFACDMYGKGVLTDDPKRASELASAFYGSPRMAARAAAGLAALAKQSGVDTNRLAAIGYCFGGSAACELAYSGADVKGVVSFHGSLPAPQPDAVPRVKARLLICHGAEDPFVKPEALTAFKTGTAKLNVQFESYPGAVHGFTNPEADARKIPGLAYQKAAAEKAWEQLRGFLAEIFR
jgi:dienelactone hydrolase